MKTRSLALAIMLGGLAAAPAFAADNSATNSAPANTNAPASAGNAGFIGQAMPGDWRASKLVGVDILGPDNKSIGAVKDVIVSHDGSIKAVVIGVGGFLGIGQKNVALPFTAIKWMDAPAPSTAASTQTAPATTGSVPATTGGAPAGNNGMAPATSTPAAPATTAAAGPQIYDYPDHGVLNMTKEQLQSAPAFSYASEKK